ncbi:Mandelate racemase/muconate lactonizing protein [Kribbella flavida DSM 17836]|uniref:Mandelate racemase/muconate lactonizing protein n=1 Tax=Kribbella flavida (strain DSM 17836 / JCM 10339 / NBRC 14399) TaxID=479435 RepID=D2PV06_KRIFD|nr:enolase C-terminal domain-like protein [Kribbella flavida]ADB31472.1 Mandelate racemase/muconate lactonizing protein [Kribbella flavida DSM 17836]
MSLDRHFVTAVERSAITSRYPRTVGRNARLGSHGSGGDAEIVILRTDTGKAGWGLVAGALPAEDQVVGRSVLDLIDPATGVRDQAVAGLDFALHDLVGQIEDQPVYAILGARGQRTISCYDGAIYFADLDPDDDPRGVPAVLADCAADDAAGYRAFKLKIGRGNRWMARAAGDARDIEVTRAVREAYPDHRILVDANDGYDCDGFIAYLQAVAEVGLYWVEEPFLDDAADLARLRAHLTETGSATLIAEGESNPELDTLLKITANGDIDVLLMDVVSFGLTSWRAVMPKVAELGAYASPHAWGLPLKTLYAAQLAAGLGRVDTVEGVPGQTLGADTSAYQWRDGELTVPDRPGFGIPLDELTGR